jgi:hypothetical protein
MRNFVSKYADTNDGRNHYTELWADETGSLLQNDTTGVKCWWKLCQIAEDLKEFRKPRRLERWIPILEYGSGQVAMSSNIQIRETDALDYRPTNGCKVIGAVKAEWVEKI